MNLPGGGMTGFVANTDQEWFEFLRAERGIDEVNFWQPSGSHEFRAIAAGSPFFFKLKKPHYAIGGFGIFAHASRIPASVAWDAFGIKNGAPSWDAMRARIAKYRSRPLAVGEDPVIGCLMITQPVFFPDAAWVAQPRDWPKNVVAGMRYDLQKDEGQRIWRACLTNAPVALVDATTAIPAAAAEAEHFGAPALVRPRLGQGSFRVAVLDAYGRACAVTREHSLPVLEAAHIRPYGSGGAHELSNGLLLRSDLHRLFDKGYVTVTPDNRFRVSGKLKDLWRNGRTYYALEGREVVLPERAELRPDRDLLAWHAREVFVA